MREFAIDPIHRFVVVWEPEIQSILTVTKRLLAVLNVISVKSFVFVNMVEKENDFFDCPCACFAQ